MVIHIYNLYIYIYKCNIAIRILQYRHLDIIRHLIYLCIIQNFYIYFLNAYVAQLAKSSDTHAVGHGFNHRPYH